MCSAPDVPQPKKPPKPQFLRNPFLDAAIGQSGVVGTLRSGRSGLRIRRDPSQTATGNTNSTFVNTILGNPNDTSNVLGGIPGRIRRANNTDPSKLSELERYAIARRKSIEDPANNPIPSISQDLLAQALRIG